MLVVNLFGAPGAGKSTGAAYIFSQLKMAGIIAELVRICQGLSLGREQGRVPESSLYLW